MTSEHLEQIAAAPWDVLVVGAGCAGAVLARQLALDGRRVLLVDRARFPRYKVCGCCLNVPAQETLNSIGLGAIIAEGQSVALNEMVVAASGKQVRFPLPGYAVMSREKLDNALADAAQNAGATFLDSASATVLPSPQEYQRFSVRRGEKKFTATAKVIVMAHGLRQQPIARANQHARIGAGAVSLAQNREYEPGILYMACGPTGYVGICRLEDGRTTIAAAMDVGSPRQSGGLASAAQAILLGAGFPPIHDILALQWKGTPLLNQRPASVASHRMFLVGDAAGYVEPFTGEGMKWALASAVALAPIAAASIENHSPALEQEWSAVHRDIVTGRTKTCAYLSLALRHQWLVRSAIVALSVAPAFAAPFVRQLNVPIPLQKGNPL